MIVCIFVNGAREITNTRATFFKKVLLYKGQKSQATLLLQQNKSIIALTFTVCLIERAVFKNYFEVQ